MNVVYLLDPKTQVGYAIQAFETAQEALDQKERFRVDYPENLFYYVVNDRSNPALFSFEEALALVNRK